jgi:hypothetical protein
LAAKPGSRLRSLLGKERTNVMQPGADDLYGWDEMPDDPDRIIGIIDRILAYTCADVMPRDVVTQDYIDQGIADLENYLARYAEFNEFLGGEL